MLIQIDLPRDRALMLANQDMTVSVFGSFNSTCHGTVATKTGQEIFTVSLMNISRMELLQSLVKAVQISRLLVLSPKWDGQGLTIHLENSSMILYSSPETATIN